MMNLARVSQLLCYIFTTSDAQLVRESRDGRGIVNMTPQFPGHTCSQLPFPCNQIY